MALVTGEIVIGRPVEAVFDYVADQRNEPEYNRRMSRSVKLTPGPIGVGTRFRATLERSRSTADLTIEVTGYDRPRRLASRTTMSAAQVVGELRFAPVGTPSGEHTRMSWTWDVRPAGAARVLGPLVGWLGARQERRVWGGLKQRLESADAAGRPAG